MPRLFTLRPLICLCFFLLISFPTTTQGVTQKAPFDFDGDNKTDLTVYRPASSTWYIFQSQTQSYRSEAFGVSTDRIVPGDYDGDGKYDVAVFRPTNMTWYIQRSRDGFQFVQWGISGDLPFAGDFDGDGKTDLVVIRTGPDNLMTWHILRSLAGYTFLTYGEVGDIPVRGDFDGDGKADVAVWRPSTGYWYYRKSSDNQDVAVAWGMGSFGDMVGAGDYDGDGKTDPAVWRSSTGVWYVLQSSNSATVSYQFGGGTYGDVPVPGDYDGDGKTDFAVWRVPTGVWHIQRSLSGYIAQQWGSQALGDKLAPFAYVPTGTVVGTVKDDADVPVENTLIEITEQGNIKAVTTTSSTGYFFVPGISTGQYEVEATYKNANASLNCSTDSYQDARLTGINLLAGGTTTVNVTLAKHKICLEDNFNSNVLGSLWQKGLIGEGNPNDLNVNVANQRLEVNIAAASGPPEVFNGIRTVVPAPSPSPQGYDLRDAYVSARMAEVTRDATPTEARIEVGPNANRKLRITIGSDSLALWRVIDNVPFLLRSRTFSRVTKAYVRIRFQYAPNDTVPPGINRGLLYLETSQTGTEGSWVNENDEVMGIVFSDFDLSAVSVSMSGGSYNATPRTETAWDDFKFAKYNALIARAGDDQTLANNNTGANLQGSYECDTCTNISNLSYKWSLTSKPVGAPDPIINSATSAAPTLSGINFSGAYNYQFRVTATYTFNGSSYTSSSTDSLRIDVAETPVARFTVHFTTHDCVAAPDCIMEDEPLAFDGSLSSGAYEYRWQFGDGREAEIPRATHIYMTPGTYTITLTVKNEAGISSTPVTKTVSVTELPSTGVTTANPTNNAQLQSEISLASARSGRTDINLAPGVDYGAINLPTRPVDNVGYIVIKSSAIGSLPPKGTRISEANISNMPRISTQTSEPAMSNSVRAHHYRFMGILFRRHPSYTGLIYNLIYLADPTPTTQPEYPPYHSLSNIPHDFVFDRCIFSNIPFPDVSATDAPMNKGLVMNSGRTSVINSHFREIKYNTDSNAVVSWAGVGPHAIINNYLEGAGENVFYGGDSMRIQYATPTDITIRGNYMYKPLRWLNDESGFALKNLLELKHARNVVIDGNVMRNSFVRGDQKGGALVLTVRNQNGDNPWSTVQNVQFTNNKVDNVGRGFGILGLDYEFPSTPAHNIIIRNNLWERVGAIVGTEPNSDGIWGQMQNAPVKVWLNHNTVFQAGNVLRGNGVPLLTNDSDFHFDNNIMRHNDYGFKGDGIASGNGFQLLNTFVPGWRMRRNVIAFDPDRWQYIGTYPNDSRNENRYIQDSGSYATFYSQFVNYAQGNFHLTTQSLGYQWATDGMDVGCNIDQLGSATAGSEPGNWPLP